MIAIFTMAGAALLAAAPPPEAFGRALPEAEAIRSSLLESTWGEPLAEAELEQQRGRYRVTLADQTLIAILEDNLFDGDYTAGSVMFSDNALTGFTGMGNFVVNTGLQANLLAGMNVTLNIEQ